MEFVNAKAVPCIQVNREDAPWIAANFDVFRVEVDYNGSHSERGYTEEIVFVAIPIDEEWMVPQPRWATAEKPSHNFGYIRHIDYSEWNMPASAMISDSCVDIWTPVPEMIAAY